MPGPPSTRRPTRSADDLDSSRPPAAAGAAVCWPPSTAPRWAALVLDAVPDGLALRRFGVVPDAQGRGVAAALVEAAVDAAVGREALAWSSPARSCPATVAFWERHGFVVDRRPAPTSSCATCLATILRRGRTPTTMRELGERVGHAPASPATSSCSPVSWARARRPSPRAWARACGVRGAVTSPTFVIARVHPSLVDGPDLVHVDAYRLGGLDELDDLDLDTSLDVGGDRRGVGCRPGRGSGRLAAGGR